MVVPSARSLLRKKTPGLVDGQRIAIATDCVQQHVYSTTEIRLYPLAILHSWRRRQYPRTILTTLNEACGRIICRDLQMSVSANECVILSPDCE